MFDFQLSTFIFQIINFFILLAALTWFLYRPLLKVMKKREEDIANHINEANEKARKADEERQSLAEEALKARQQSDALMTETRTEASHAKEQVLEQARAEAARLIEEAQRRITEQERATEQRLQARLVEAAVGMAGGIIRQAAGPDLHNALLNELTLNGTGLESDQLELLQEAMAHGDGRIRVEVAYPPTPEVEKRVREMLSSQLGRNTEGLQISFMVEPSLVAGTRILVGTVAVDLSLSRTLSELGHSPDPEA